MLHNRGMLTVATVITDPNFGPDRREKMEEHIHTFLRKRSVRALTKIISADDPFKGSEKLIEAYGLGKLFPNTVILGDSKNEEHLEKYCNMINHFYDINRNVILLRSTDNGEDEDVAVFGERKRIDLWWGGFKGNGGLMMILSYLLQKSIRWRNAQIRLKIGLDNEEAEEDVRKNINSILDEIRIEAQVDIIALNGRSFDQVLRETSQGADLIILGLATPNENYTDYYKKIHDMTEDLPTTLFVLAGQDISFGDVLIPQDTMKG